MNRSRITDLIVLLSFSFLVVLWAIVVPSAFAVEGEAPAEPLSPSTITISSSTVQPGESLSVSIDLAVPAPNSLTALTIDIQYDPTVLTSDGTCFANTAPANFTLNLCNRSDGDGVPPDVFSYSAINVTGVNGMINLGSIPFVASSTGASDLIIVVRTFNDGSGETPITINGSVTVQDPTAIGLSNLSARITPSAGLMVLILLFSALTLVVVARRQAQRMVR